MRTLLVVFAFCLTALLSGQPIYKQDAILQKGYRAYYNGEYDNATRYFLEALRNAKENKNELIEAESYRLLGELNRASSNRKYALVYLDKAEALFSKIGNQYGLASTKNRKAATYFEMGDTTSMLKTLDNSIKTSRENGFLDILYNDLTIKGAYSQWVRKNPEEALVSLQEAREIVHSLNAVEDYPYVYINIARVYQSMNRSDSAVIYGLQAYENSLKYHTRAYVATSAGLLSLLYGQIGDYQKAWEYERIYNLQQDTLMNEKKAKEISDLAEKFRSTEQEQKLDLRKKQLNFTVTILACVLIFAIIIFISYTRSKKLNQDLSRLSQELQIKQGELESNNRIKDKLLSVLSHDLRSPVATIQQTLDLLREDEMSRSEQKEIFTILEIQTIRTSQLLDNLLQWIKNQLRNIEVQKREISLNELVIESIELSQLPIQHKSIEVINELPDNTTIIADREMIKLVLRNLISNAVKFSANHGKIRIRGGKTEGHCWFEISDEGMGIGEEKLKDLFTLQQMATVGNNNEVGMGLGLSLVKDFVEKNGGTVQVTSELNKGSSFRISFPLAFPDPAVLPV